MSIILQRVISLPICGRCFSRAFAYKSIYNVDNLYPGSRDIVLTYSSQSEKPSEYEKFEGEIPIKKLIVKYSKSSGPGGQHVNSTLTKVEVRFHVMTSEWIPHHLRSIILEKFRTRVNKCGELIVRNEDSRYQLNNLKNCLEQIRGFIREAEKPPDRSKEKRIAELNNMESIQAAHKKRLAKKRMHSYTKSMRSFADE